MTDIDQIKRKVKNHELSLAIALFGDERAFVDEALDLIRKAYLPSPSLIPLNHHKMTLGEDDLSDLIPTLLSMPFLAQHRLVEVHAAEKISTKDASAIIDYLKNPSSSSLLVMVFNKLDKKNKLIETIEALGGLFVFAPLHDTDRVNFVVNEAQRFGMAINPTAAQLLITASSGDLLLIKAGIEKLALLHKNEEISVDDVETNILASDGQDVFLLARYISEGKLKDALLALGLLRNSQENALKFLGVLIWQFRLILHIRHCFDQGMSLWDIRKEVSLFGDRFTWMANIAKKRNTFFHIERLIKLLDCDYALKSGAVCEPFHYLEKIVYQSSSGL